VPVGNSPYGVAVNVTSNRIFDTNNGSNSASIIDGTSNTVGQTLAVGNGPQGVGVNSATLTGYVANGGDNTVSVITTFEGTPNISNSTAKAWRRSPMNLAGLMLRLLPSGFPASRRYRIRSRRSADNNRAGSPPNPALVRGEG
jgi:YVTN family beta-propeller protein